MTLETLKEMSLQIDPTNLYSIRKINGQIEMRKFLFSRIEEDTYFTSSYVCAFFENKILYVLPYWQEVIDTLKEYGFLYSRFYVPFANSEVPVWAENEWAQMKALAETKRHEEFVSKCLKLADEKGYGQLPDEILAKCILAPPTGIRIKLGENRFTCLTSWGGADFMDSFATENRFGKFGISDNTVVFLYRTGDTYIAPKTDAIIEALISAGYSFNEVWVPELNSKTSIADTILRAQWEQFKAC